MSNGSLVDKKKIMTVTCAKLGNAVIVYCLISKRFLSDIRWAAAFLIVSTDQIAVNLLDWWAECATAGRKFFRHNNTVSKTRHFRTLRGQIEQLEIYSLLSVPLQYLPNKEYFQKDRVADAAIPARAIWWPTMDFRTQKKTCCHPYNHHKIVTKTI